MVTETRPILTQDQSGVKTDLDPKPVLDVRDVGGRIGIPVVIRPWWGSRRQLYERRHKKCGSLVYQWGGWYCSKCKWDVKPNEIENIKLRPGRWVCPAWYSQRINWPEVIDGHVVMWEGRCGARYYAAQISRYGFTTHVHRQTLEVLDFTSDAMLVRVSVNNHRLSFLIGRDDGHPFVQVVTKNQATVAEAYDFLVPAPVFQAQMHGFDVKRQGDWFFVPIEFWRSRPVRDEKRRVRPWPGRLDSASASADSGTIYSNAPIGRTRHIAERLIWIWPYDLVKGAVTAPDHPPVELETWHRAVRVRQTAAVNGDGRNDD